jgi:hypothetical protein
VVTREDDEERQERAYRLIGEIVDGIVAQTCARHYLAPTCFSTYDCLEIRNNFFLHWSNQFRGEMNLPRERPTHKTRPSLPHNEQPRRMCQSNSITRLGKVGTLGTRVVVHERP